MAITQIDAVSPNGVGHLAADDATDVPNLPKYAQANGLKQGTDCIVIDTGDVHIEKSDGSFKKM